MVSGKESKKKSRKIKILDILLTKIRVNISPSDYFTFQFHKRNPTWEEKRRYIGTKGSLYWPFDLNRLKFTTTLTNKYAQKCLLQGFGLPTPPLITTIGPHFEIHNFDRFQSFLKSCRQDIVIKPVHSKGGKNILVLDYRDKNFFLIDENYTPERIWQYLESMLDTGFLVEEKKSNNSQIRSLFPNSLNCFRVCTIQLREGDWKIITWGLKLGQGKSVIDNTEAGGLYVILDDKGHSVDAYSHDFKRSLTHHPDSGAALVGIQLENSDKVREMALEASRKFGFLGTIRWDIALTEEGPLLIGGNNFWSVLDQKVLGGHITDEIAGNLKRHPFLSRWDKTRMFPNFNRKMKTFRQ